MMVFVTQEPGRSQLWSGHKVVSVRITQGRIEVKVPGQEPHIVDSIEFFDSAKGRKEELSRRAAEWACNPDSETYKCM